MKSKAFYKSAYYSCVLLLFSGDERKTKVTLRMFCLQHGVGANNSSSYIIHLLEWENKRVSALHVEDYFSVLFSRSHILHSFGFDWQNRSNRR